MALTIVTDHKWKNFKYGYEVPEKVLKDLGSYIAYDGYIQYRGQWYDLADFMILDKNSSFPKPWQAYQSDSAFSGIVIEVSNDGEQYRIGTYFS